MLETIRQYGERKLAESGDEAAAVYEAHVSNILRKLGVSGRVQAVCVAHRLGFGP